MKTFSYYGNNQKGLCIASSLNMCFLLVMIVACSLEGASDKDGFIKQSDNLYQTYLNGNRDQAKRSLEDSIILIEKSKLQKGAEADCLCFTYSRLYVLEKRSGNDELADLYWIKVRYWYLRNRELSGNNIEEISEAVRGYTVEKCITFVDKWDKSHSEGKGPRYLK